MIITEDMFIKKYEEIEKPHIMQNGNCNEKIFYLQKLNGAKDAISKKIKEIGLRIIIKRYLPHLHKYNVYVVFGDNKTEYFKEYISQPMIYQDEISTCKEKQEYETIVRHILYELNKNNYFYDKIKVLAEYYNDDYFKNLEY